MYDVFLKLNLPNFDFGQATTLNRFLFVKAVPSYVCCKSLSELVYHFSWLLCYLVMMHCSRQKQEQLSFKNTDLEMAADQAMAYFFFLVS